MTNERQKQLAGLITEEQSVKYDDSKLKRANDLMNKAIAAYKEFGKELSKDYPKTGAWFINAIENAEFDFDETVGQTVARIERAIIIYKENHDK